MGNFQTFLINLRFYQCKLRIQFQDFLNKPLYNQFPCFFSFTDANTRLGVLQDFSSSAIPASSKFRIMPDLPDSVFFQSCQIIRKWCLLQQFKAECAFCFSKCFFVLWKIYFQFPVQSVDRPDPVLIQLITKHG